MKKAIIAILVCSMLPNVVLAAEYLFENHSTERYRELFYINALFAWEHFSVYHETGRAEEFTLRGS